MHTSKNISVVIPTYNGSKFIEETVNSIFSQEVLPKEIIVVDDVSKDNTKDIVLRLSSISPIPLHFFQLDKNSGGPAEPINTGIKKAKGKYIAICEQDDCMLPNKIKMLDEFISLEPQVQFIISRYKVLVSKNVKDCAIQDDSYSEFENIKKFPIKEPFYLLDKRSAYKKALDKCFAASLSNMCFSKELWYSLKGLNKKIKRAVDWDFLLRVSHGYQIGWIDQVLWKFRRHSESIVRKTDILMWGKDYIEIWTTQLKLVNDSKERLEIKRRFSNQLAGVAYRARGMGDYNFALKCYLYQLVKCKRFTSVIDIGKLGIHFMIKNNRK